MDGRQCRRRVGLGGVAIGMALGALLGVGSPVAAGEVPAPHPVPGDVAGRVDIAAELARMSWAAGGSMAYEASPSGDAWASTQQYTGRPF